MSEQLDQLAKEMRANSERWFPAMHENPVIPLWLFYGIGTASESGEQLDVLKKACRENPPNIDMDKLRAEMADVFTYLLLLADELQVDLVAEYRAKVVVNEARWGVSGE